MSVQLIDSQSGGHIWADRFDRDVADLLEMQEEITGRIALALHYKMTEIESRRARDQRSDNPDARGLQFRGWAALHRPSSKKTLAEARDFFERALELDDHSASAWAGLSEAHSGDLLGRWSDPPTEQLRKAEEAAARALACDPTNAEAHLARAAVLLVQTKLEAALDEYTKVNELGRVWPVAYGRMGLLSALLGRPEETYHLVERAMRLSPRDHQLGEWYLSIGIAEFMMDHFEQAILWLRRSTEAGPELGVNYLALAAAFGLIGGDHEARAALSEYRRLNPDMSIAKLRTSPYSNHPRYRTWREWFLEGLRKAGMPEQ